MHSLPGQCKRRVVRTLKELGVRTQKESESANCTNFLKREEVATGHNMERWEASKGYSQPGEVKGQDKSGHKESKSVRGTHNLERVKCRTDQDIKTKQVSEDTYKLEGARVRTG